VRSGGRIRRGVTKDELKRKAGRKKIEERLR
jgi:hypothetical protein